MVFVVSSRKYKESNMKKTWLFKKLFAVGIATLIVVTSSGVLAFAAQTSEQTSSEVTQTSSTIIPNDETGIPDKALYNYLLDYDTNKDGQLSISEAESITGDKWYFNYSNAGIKDLTGIKYLKNLQYLALSNNQITDLTPLKDLKNLKEIEFSNNKIADISALSDMTNLTRLVLSGNQIANISVLAGLTNLTFLDLSANQITDVSGLSNLTKLDCLELSNNNIKDVTPLVKVMSNLTFYLYLDYNDISTLPNMKELTNLNCGGETIGTNEYAPIVTFVGNNITETEAKAKLPKQLLEGKISSKSNTLWFDMQGFIKSSSSAETGQYIVDLTGGVTLISTDTFSSLLQQNKEKDLVVKSNNGVTFTFAKGTMLAVDGKDSYDFGTKLIYDFTQIKDITKNITADNFAFQINYNYTGQLPADASIKIYAGTQWVGKALYYYYYSEDGTLDFMQASTVDADGYITVTQSHCSNYVALTSELTSELTTDAPSNQNITSDTSSNQNITTETVKTGDASVVVVYALLCVSMIGIITFVSKHKKRTE